MDRFVTRQNQILFNAMAAVGVSPVVDVKEFTNVIVALTAPLNTTLHFKFQGSIGKSVSSEAAPTFSSAQAVTNMWDYVASYDLNDPNAVITGDTGVTIDNAAAAVNTHLYMINVSLLRYFSVEIDSWTDGSLTGMVILGTN